MNLNLGSLLANGKTVVGLSGGPVRYRLSSAAPLPKFLSPKNPFAEGEAASKASAARTRTDKADQSDKSDKSDVSDQRAEAKKARTEMSRVPVSARAVNRLSEWGMKLRPQSRRERSPGPVRALAQQGELSLDTVRVVRNDLSDADAEVVGPTCTKLVLPVVARTAEKLEPVGAAW